MPTSARADLLQEAKIWKSVLDSKNLGFSSNEFFMNFHGFFLWVTSNSFFNMYFSR